MKTLNKLKVAIILLFVAVIIFASFFGVYKKEDFRVVNLIKGYNLGMQFTNSIELKGTIEQEEKEVIYDKDGNVVENDGETEYTEENGYTVKTEKVNNDEILNEKNLKLTKKIIKDRLKGLNIGEYKIKLDKETGDISIRIQENDNAHEIEELLLQKGEITIIDKETEEVLLDNKNIESAKVVYGSSKSDMSTTIIYLQLNFDKEGTKKLEEISQIYVETKTSQEETEEELEEDQNDEINAKYISVVFDGQTLTSNYFGEKMSTGVLNIYITQASDTETLTQYVNEVNKIATVINSGVLPIEYDFDEEIVESSFNKDKLIILIASFAFVFIVELVYITIKYKTKGFLTGFMQIGYIALLLLAIRYTNVVTTVQGIIGIGISAVLNLIFTIIVLDYLKTNNNIDWKIIGKFALWTTPLYIIAVILSFNNLTVINSLGMTLVWGSICLYLYNLTLTKALLEMFSK